MGIPRFFVAGAREPEIIFDAEESTHALRVLRLGVGDRVIVFDGAGREYECEVVEAHRRVRARVLECRESRREVPHRITIASAVPKGWRLEFMIEKLAELGAAGFIPVRFDRSVARLGSGKLERLRRVAVAASKQSGRSTILEIRPEIELHDLKPEGALYVAMPEARERLAASSDCTVLIGPEGGFTTDEESLFVSLHASPVRLGPTILRVETAAITAMGLIASS